VSGSNELNSAAWAARSLVRAGADSDTAQRVHDLVMATQHDAPAALGSSLDARKLHVGHFAFMRAVVQGLDARDSWERYFRVDGEATDQRTVRATIAWIRDAFAAAAKRHDRFGTARLVRLDATRLADPSQALPSLDAFAQARGLQDERQADQIAAYDAEHGRATQRLRRRARLVARQLQALRWLETLVAQAPKAGDAVAAWLNPTLAQRLEAVGIVTLAQLAERINGIGQRWHAGIPALGEGKALRIVDWLRAHAPASTGLVVGAHVAMPRSQLFDHELQCGGGAGHRHPAAGEVHRAGRAGRQPGPVPPAAGPVPAAGHQRPPGHPGVAAVQARPQPGADGAAAGAPAPA
jgi:hypothetical protein